MILVRNAKKFVIKSLQNINLILMFLLSFQLVHDIFVFEHFYNFFFIFSLLQNFLTLNYIKYVALRFITDFSYVLLEFCSIFVFLSCSEQHSFDFTAQAQRADEKVGKDADEH